MWGVGKGKGNSEGSHDTTRLRAGRFGKDNASSSISEHGSSDMEVGDVFSLSWTDEDSVLEPREGNGFKVTSKKGETGDSGYFLSNFQKKAPQLSTYVAIIFVLSAISFLPP